MLAAVVPCPDCHATGRTSDGFICATCNGDGTRTVVTDVEVEPVPVVDDYDTVCSAYAGPTAIEVTPNGMVLLYAEWDSSTEDEGTDIGGLFSTPPAVGSAVWREVQP